jgi:hypothetical protein
MCNTQDAPAKKPDDRMNQGGNYWTLFTPGIWKVLHAVFHSFLGRATRDKNGIIEHVWCGSHLRGLFRTRNRARERKIICMFWSSQQRLNLDV